MNFHSFGIDVLRLCLWLALLSALFMPLERLFALRRQTIFRHETLIDLGYYFINSLMPAVLLGLPMSLVAVVAQHIVPTAISATLGGLPLAVKLLLTLVIGEIGFYWGHRLSHQVAWLWRFHSLHHSAEHLYFLVNTRAHPVDIVFTRLVGLTPLYILGLAGPGAAGSAAPVALIVIGTVWGFFIHANLRWRIKPLEWLVATPVFHHWHHSRIDHIDHNYASMLPLLDRLFGTLYMPSQWPSDYGIAAPLPATLSGQLIEPLLPAIKNPPAASDTSSL
jgi:sterol desaturase/sphingolipid hydroxylase (fatty acid hydroxylase superfamily)